jgi:hypothetical protein
MTKPKDQKPNLIFDVTLKDLKKLDKLTTAVKKLGYDEEKIHIVWVLNDVEIAKKQNLDPKRGRIVPPEILVNTHIGVSNTMSKILDMGIDLQKYMDGAMYIVFNQANVDNHMATSKNGGTYMIDAKYLKIKEPGKKPMTKKDLTDEILSKIKSYVPPDTGKWEK